MIISGIKFQALWGSFCLFLWYVWGGMYTHTSESIQCQYVCIQRTEKILGVLFYYSLHYSLESGCFPQLGVTLAASKPHKFSCLYPTTALKLQTHVDIQFYHVSAGEMNSDTYVCASTSLTHWGSIWSLIIINLADLRQSHCFRLRLLLHTLILQKTWSRDMNGVHCIVVGA